MISNAVVIAISAAVATGQRDGFASTNVFIAKHASGTDCHGVATHQARQSRRATVNGGRCSAVIHFVGRCNVANRERFGGDIGCTAGLASDAVIVSISACVSAGQCDCFRRTHVFIAKHTSGTDG